MIMVSYRRADAQDMAGRISDYLIAKYGDKSVFFDVNSIGTGVDYRRRVESAIIGSDVMVAVIGLNWLGKHPEGKPPRVYDPGDPVRIEIETALTHKKPILPLLVNGALMPEEAELPDTLRQFHYCNAAKIDSGRDFRMHMSYLVQSINEALGITEIPSIAPPPSQLGRLSAYGAAALVALAALLFWSDAFRFTPSEADTPPTTGTKVGVPTSASTRANANGGFLIKDSDRRVLREEDLKGFSLVELRLARNEIYARRGRLFVDQSLVSYFSQFSWYHPHVGEVELSPIETTNVNTIQLAERQR